MAKLRERGCRVVTTDPFLGMLSEQDPRQLVSIHIPEGSSPELKHTKEVEDQRLWSHFSRSEEILARCYHLYPAHAAFGGYKQSGIGRETHLMMLKHYQQTKNLLVSYDENPMGFF